MVETTIRAEQLQKWINHPDWVILDCRFDLQNPAWGFREYQKGHIPNAFFADLDRDLSSPKHPGTGRHPLPDLETFSKTCSKWGIEKGKQVVVYDTVAGSFASRVWWLLNYLGHREAAVLEGGFSAWEKLNLPVSTETPAFKNADFIPDLQNQLFVSSEELVKQLHQPNLLLIDSRAPLRYAGIEEPLDKLAGHIPGAVNRFHQENLTEDELFISDETLKKQFSELSKGELDQKEIIVYCGSGVTSCLNLVALKKIGIDQAKLYLGSWSEWIEDPARPVVTKK